MSAPMRRAATLGIRAALRTSTTAPAAQCLNAYAAAPVVSQRHPARWTDAISSRGFASESDDDFKPKRELLLRQRSKRTRRLQRRLMQLCLDLTMTTRKH